MVVTGAVGGSLDVTVATGDPTATIGELAESAGFGWMSMTLRFIPVLSK